MCKSRKQEIFIVTSWRGPVWLPGWMGFPGFPLKIPSPFRFPRELFVFDVDVKVGSFFSAHF